MKLSKALRKDFNEPNSKFVCASPGQTKNDGTVAGGETLDAMQAVDGKSRKHADFIGKTFDNHVATRCSRGLSALAENVSNDSTRPTRFLESYRRDKPASGNPSD